MKLFGFAILLMGIAVNFSHADNMGKVIQTGMQVCTSKMVMNCQKAFESPTENPQKCLSHELLKRLQYVENSDCKVEEDNLKDLDDNEKKLLMDCNMQYQGGDKCKDCFETTECVKQQMQKGK